MIDLEFILSNLDEYPWDHNGISIRYDVNMDIAKSINIINWNWRYLCGNHSTTLDFVKKNLPVDDIEWSELSLNPNVLCNFDDIITLSRKHMAAFKIQQYWRKAISCPHYTICKKRLFREATEIEEEFLIKKKVKL